jgi:hypothetical protein
MILAIFVLKLYEIKNRKYNVFNPQGRERELLQEV